MVAEPLTRRSAPRSLGGDDKSALTLTYVAADDTDLPMFEEMVRDAMAAFYDAHQLSWQSDGFRAGFMATENYRIEQKGCTVGVLRFSVQAECLYLFDLHVAPHMRHRGIGGQTLDALTALAARCGKTWGRLRSFADNPANRLYERAGFVRVGEEGPLLRLEKRVG